MATVAVAKGVVTVTGKKAGRTTITVTRNGASEKTNVEVETTGWKLVPVVVAAKDLAEGTIVTAADLEQRDVPEFMVTTTVVRAKALNYIVAHQLLVQAQAGDLMAWTLFATKK